MKIFHFLAYICFGVALLGTFVAIQTGEYLLVIPVVITIVIVGLFLLVLQLFVDLLTDIRDALRGKINVIINDAPVTPGTGGPVTTQARVRKDQ